MIATRGLAICVLLVSAFVFAALSQEVYAQENRVLKVDAKASKKPITRGDLQTITISVTDGSGKPTERAAVFAIVNSPGQVASKRFIGLTDEKGSWSFTYEVPSNSRSGLAGVDVKAVKAGYERDYASEFYRILAKK